MHTKKFVHTFFYMFLSIMISNVTQCASGQIAKGNDTWSSFLTPRHKMYTAPFALGGGFGAYTLSDRLVRNQSWQSLAWPAVLLAASPALLSNVQAEYRKKTDPKHENLLSQWWFPAAGTFGAIALFSAYKNNLLPGLACGALLSAPAMFYAWKLARDERNEQEKKASRVIQGIANRGMVGSSTSKQELRDALEIMKLNNNFAKKYTASPRITMGQINNLIPAYKDIGQQDLKGVLRDIIIQSDALIGFKSGEEQKAIDTLQTVLGQNIDRLAADFITIKEHDFIKLLKSLEFLKDQRKNFAVGAALKQYDSKVVSNLLDAIQGRARLYEAVGLSEKNKQYQHVIEFIKEAQQEFNDIQELLDQAIVSEAKKSADEMMRRAQESLGDSVGRYEIAAALVAIEDAELDDPNSDPDRKLFFRAVDDQIFANEEHYFE